MTRHLVRTWSRAHPIAFLILTIVVATMTAAAGAVVLSNLLEYPGTVANQMVVSAPWLGANGTGLTWYVGVRKNVSITVQENGYAGTAHAVYEVLAGEIACTDVTMAGFYGDAATCTVGTDVVTLDANAKTFTGTGSIPWWFYLTVNRVFSSVTLRICVVQY